MRDLQATAVTTFRQPCQALEPRAFALEAAEEWALRRATGLSLDRFRITSFWYIDFTIQHVPGERTARYTMLLAQSDNYGIAASLTSTLRDTEHPLALWETDQAFVGEDCREILKDRRFRDDLDRTALIDLVMGQVSLAATHQATLDQTIRDKHALKSRLFADEAEGVLRRKGLDVIKGSRPHVHVIGAMAGTHAALITRGFEVTATDGSADVVGRNLGGVTVRDATESESFVKAADLVIMTGMTLPNRTLPALMEAAKTNNTSTMLWAVTGKNFGEYYIEHGVDCVISDPSPFLLLPGAHTIGIWRREL
jgi:hypothetical protein